MSHPLGSIDTSRLAYDLTVSIITGLVVSLVNLLIFRRLVQKKYYRRMFVALFFLFAIITFLMVFLIQNTQNRESYAVQLKLDEIIRAVEGAHNSLLDIEELNEKQLLRMKNNYEALAKRAREELEKGLTDKDCPEIRND